MTSSRILLQTECKCISVYLDLIKLGSWSGIISREGKSYVINMAADPVNF
jgi:hypothetical protein